MPERRNTFRIIAGRWRGRRLVFPELPGLRPTPDRVRETVFNWLIPIIDGSRCLDLFSGSGALGLEALSRGASHVTFVDSHNDAISQLRKNLQTLQIDSASWELADVNSYLQRPAQTFDIVFVDAPYRQALLSKTFAVLAKNAWLHPGSRVYFEHSRDEEAPKLPENWDLIRSKVAGQVAYHLVKCS